MEGYFHGLEARDSRVFFTCTMNAGVLIEPTKQPRAKKRYCLKPPSLLDAFVILSLNTRHSSETVKHVRQRVLRDILVEYSCLTLWYYAAFLDTLVRRLGDSSNIRPPKVTCHSAMEFVTRWCCNSQAIRKKRATPHVKSTDDFMVLAASTN